MRFRTLLVVNKVAFIAKLLAVLQKVEKTGVIIFCSDTEDEVRLITRSDALNGLYSSSLLKKSEFFENYRIESKYHNLIALEFQLSAFEDAIRASTNATVVVMKLSKKEAACVTFQIQTLLNSKTSTIIQDVPVTVLSPTQIEEIAEPSLPPSIGVVLSPPQKVAHLIEKFRHVSHFVQVSVHLNNSSELRLKAEQCQSETLEVESCIKGLKLVTMNNEESTSQLDETRTARVDGRQLSKALYSISLYPQRVFCFVLSNLVLIHLELAGIDLSYYVSAFITLEKHPNQASSLVACIRRLVEKVVQPFRAQSFFETFLMLLLMILSPFLQGSFGYPLKCSEKLI
eukprot:jgi/Galph1/3081/GphlegSOOS_G1742.1